MAFINDIFKKKFKPKTHIQLMYDEYPYVKKIELQFLDQIRGIYKNIAKTGMTAIPSNHSIALLEMNHICKTYSTPISMTLMDKQTKIKLGSFTTLREEEIFAGEYMAQLFGIHLDDEEIMECGQTLMAWSKFDYSITKMMVLIAAIIESEDFSRKNKLFLLLAISFNLNIYLTRKSDLRFSPVLPLVSFIDRKIDVEKFRGYEDKKKVETVKNLFVEMLETLEKYYVTLSSNKKGFIKLLEDNGVDVNSMNIITNNVMFTESFILKQESINWVKLKPLVIEQELAVQVSKNNYVSKQHLDLLKTLFDAE